MTTYTPALGERPDGICGCGAPATAEVQVGWHNGSHGQPSGGQYDECCAACYSATDEAEDHRRQRLAVLRYVRDGRFAPDASGRYRGPHGMSFSAADHAAMKAELATADPAEVESARHSLDWSYTPEPATYRTVAYCTATGCSCEHRAGLVLYHGPSRAEAEQAAGESLSGYSVEIETLLPIRPQY